MHSVMHTEWNEEEEERAMGRKEIKLLSRGSERSEIPRDPKTPRLEEVYSVPVQELAMHLRRQ